MSKLKHFSLANMPSEDISTYLARLGVTIKNAHASEIIDLIVQQPDDRLKEKQITATVYMDGGITSDSVFEMESYVEYVTADTAREALLSCISLQMDWLKANQSVEVYDVKYDFGVEQGGQDIVKMSIYYAQPEK